MAINKLNRREFLATTGSFAAMTALIGPSLVRSESNKPNIIWIMAEDIGCDLACYGMAAVKTPTLDQLAKEGLQCNRAYVTGPICSPSRSAMMTGMYQTTIDAQHHRSHRSDGYHLPEPVKPITDYLRRAGYYCAIGCGYGDKTDLNFETEHLFDGKDWSQRADGQPFFAQIQLGVTHRGKWWDKTRRESKHPVDPDKIELPPIFPDHPDVRQDWAEYLDQIEKADDQVAEILQRLDAEGIADNTMVIFIGDNGRCHLRGKGFLYEEGIRVPLIIRWPGRIKPAIVSDELVSMIDVSAQIFDAAGVQMPDYIQGHPFLSELAKPRDYVFAARDRWDDVEDKIRCVVGKRYKYIRNDRPDVPWDSYYAYLENSWVRPTYPLLRKMYRDNQLNAVQKRFFEPRKPKEELYDLQKDPYELENLAGQQEFEPTLRQLRDVLRRWEVETNDHGRMLETDASKGQANLRIIEEAKHAHKKIAP
jgi:N-sulfoglucosamine sulfohydrolase